MLRRVSDAGGTAPGPARYRCNACGNLTRFTVTSTRRTRAFHHFTLGGELTVEDEELLEHAIEDVTCRWCGTGASVEAVPHVP
jgi:hypothetical protein